MDNISKAAEMLFGADGIGATNVRLFPGSRDASPSERAGELIKIFERIERGEFTVARAKKG